MGFVRDSFYTRNDAPLNPKVAQFSGFGRKERSAYPGTRTDELAKMSPEVRSLAKIEEEGQEESAGIELTRPTVDNRPRHTAGDLPEAAGPSQGWVTASVTAALTCG